MRQITHVYLLEMVQATRLRDTFHTETIVAAAVFSTPEKAMARAQLNETIVKSPLGWKAKIDDDDCIWVAKCVWQSRYAKEPYWYRVVQLEIDENR